jgi:hemerythrin-like domain-containing protein
MAGMRRDPSLIPLSHQHHNGLALCVLTDRSLQADSSAANIAKLAHRIVDRYELELINHFQLEEDVLFPAISSLPLVPRLIAEHREVTSIVDGLRTSPDAAALQAFTALLRRHIRTEEGELFEEAQKLLPREKLDEIGKILDEHAVRVCL